MPKEPMPTVDELKAKLAAERKQREEKCLEAVNAAMEEYDCTARMSLVVTEQGNRFNMTITAN
jgi:hypothetical protein